MIDCPFVPFAKRIIIFAGAYGSGKTEVAVNYAIHLAEISADPISIIDLDIVNPYFRSREAAAEMLLYGIRAIVPTGEHCHADLPIIVPQIRASIENAGEGRLVIDVGGDDLGARVLGSLSDALERADYEFLMVLNANRPFTATVEGSLKMMRAIEGSSRMKFTGIVSNTHLIGETTGQTIIDGVKLSRQVAEAAKIPLVFAAGMDAALGEIADETLTVPKFSLSRRMLKPWEIRKDRVRGL